MRVSWNIAVNVTRHAVGPSAASRTARKRSAVSATTSPSAGTSSPMRRWWSAESWALIRSGSAVSYSTSASSGWPVRDSTSTT